MPRIATTMAQILREWLIITPIEEDDDDEQPKHRERIIHRNGRRYYENTETEEYTLIGIDEEEEETSAHEWVSNKTTHRGFAMKYDTIIVQNEGSGGPFINIGNPVVIETDVERTEYFEPWWNIGDGMGSWEPMPFLVYPNHWLCSCRLIMPKALSSCDNCDSPNPMVRQQAVSK